MIRTALAAALASLLLAATAGAGRAAPAPHAPPPAWVGVWQGTVGKAEVKLCLQLDHRARGAYYYARYLRVISLEGEEKAQLDPLTVALTEAMPLAARAGRPGATETVAWSLRASADRRALEGTWRSSARTLPVQLSRLAAAESERSGCEGDAFNAPLERPGRVVAKEARLRETAYRALSLAIEQQPDIGIATFELLREDAGAARFNAAMRKRLQDEQQEMFACMRGALGSNGLAGDYAMHVEPRTIGRRWLVAGEGGSRNCGGAHPSHHIGQQTWDLEAGRVVDPWTWFGPKGAVIKVEGAPRHPTVEIGAALRALLARHWANAACADVLEGDHSWTAFPGATGTSFMPRLPHAMMACSDDVTVPWPKIVPLLNAQGRRAVESVRADFAAPPER